MPPSSPPRAPSAHGSCLDCSIMSRVTTMHSTDIAPPPPAVAVVATILHHVLCSKCVIPTGDSAVQRGERTTDANFPQRRCPRRRCSQRRCLRCSLPTCENVFLVLSCPWAQGADPGCTQHRFCRKLCISKADVYMRIARARRQGSHFVAPSRRS